MDKILYPIEYRKKEIRIKAPWYEYITIGVLGGIVAIMLIIVLAIMFALPFSADFSNRNYYGIAEVHGNSMYPYINEGEYVLYITQNHPDFHINIGDVAVYYDEEKDIFIAHRVVDIYSYNNVLYVITKGDNNDYYDNPIKIDEIKAEVVDIIHNDFEKWCYEVWLNIFNWW